MDQSAEIGPLSLMLNSNEKVTVFGPTVHYRDPECGYLVSPKNPTTWDILPILVCVRMQKIGYREKCCDAFASTWSRESRAERVTS